MALDAATLAWISRLPAAPTSADRARLLVLQRHTVSPTDSALLDSVIGATTDAPGRRSRRTDLVARRTQIERRLSAMGGSIRAAQDAFQSTRIERALTEQLRMHPEEAGRKARSRTSSDREAERSSLREQLREVNRELRQLTER